MQRKRERKRMRRRHSKVMSSVRQAQFHGGEGSFPIRSLEVILHLGINRGRPSEITKSLSSADFI